MLEPEETQHLYYQELIQPNGVVIRSNKVLLHMDVGGQPHVFRISAWGADGSRLRITQNELQTTCNDGHLWFSLVDDQLALEIAGLLRECEESKVIIT